MVLVAFTLNAQDMIHKTDETVISAKVLEINTGTVKYKLYSSTTDKVFELSKNDIHYIVYQNGVKEFYNTSPKPAYVEREREEVKPVEKTDNKVFFKNIIALNCFDMFFTNFSASYERILNSGKFSFKIPLSIGLKGKPNTTNYTSDFWQTQFLQNRNYAAGLEFNIYPLGQTRNTFYVGLSTFAGTFNYYKSTTVPYPYYPFTTSGQPIEYEGVHYSGMIHLGGYLRLGDNFLIGSKLGVGFKREETIEVNNYTLPTAQFDFNLAYCF